MTVLLVNTGTVQFKNEAVYGVAETVGNNDAALVEEPMFSIDAQTLERSFVKADLSPLAIITGRKIAKMNFSVELRGNGSQHSGLIANAPMLTRMFRACGYAMTAAAATSSKGPYNVGLHANPVTWTVAGANVVTSPRMYIIEVTTAGPSATAAITVTSDTPGEGAASNTITAATPETLGTSGVTIAGAFTGELALGQSWVIWVLPKGMFMTPVSDNFESATIVMNKSGVQHTMPGAFGTFDIEAEAGQYGKVNFEFQGIYSAPVDAPLSSTLVYESQLPQQVELAKLRVGSFNAIVNKFTFDQANDIQPRPDVSSADGYIGLRLVGRAPEGGIDPEADLVAAHDFWGRMAQATRMPFSMRVGTSIGNTIQMMAPCTQYTGLTYTDRSNILTYDAGLRFSGVNGNDEFMMHFC